MRNTIFSFDVYVSLETSKYSHRPTDSTEFGSFRENKNLEEKTRNFHRWGNWTFWGWSLLLSLRPHTMRTCSGVDTSLCSRCSRSESMSHVRVFVCIHKKSKCQSERNQLCNFSFKFWKMAATIVGRICGAGLLKSSNGIVWQRVNSQFPQSRYEKEMCFEYVWHVQNFIHKIESYRAECPKWVWQQFSIRKNRVTRDQLRINQRANSANGNAVQSSNGATSHDSDFGCFCCSSHFILYIFRLANLSSVMDIM